MDEILKGNFKIKNPDKLKLPNQKKNTLSKKLRKKVLSTLGGSLVYMERTPLTWNVKK